MARFYSRVERDEGSAPPTLMRERPQSVRMPMTESRDAFAERPDDVRPEFSASLLVNGGSLQAPKPRMGFVQRWIADGSLDAKDTAHWMKKRRAGWAPRDPETVPKHERDMFQTAKNAQGEGIIRVAGLVLCEMPVAVANARKGAVNDLIEHQRKSVPESTQQLRDKKDPRVGPLQVEDKEQFMRGRPSATLVD